MTSTSKVVALLLTLCTLSSCSYTATIHRYGGPSVEAEIVASDPNNLVVRDQYGEAYEVPARTVTEVDHPGTAWIITGLVIAALGAIPALTSDDDVGNTIGFTYVGMGGGIALIGGIPYLESKMNSSGADLRSGQKLVPGTDMPVRRVNEKGAPRGPATRP